MNFVKFSKKNVQIWEMKVGNLFWAKFFLFYWKHHIIFPNMSDLFVIRRRSRLNVKESTNFYHYRVEVYYAMIDMQLQELNIWFKEVNTELLLCRLIWSNRSFSAFDNIKLTWFVEFYISDFSSIERAVLDFQLDNYILDVRSNKQFFELKELVSLLKNG